MLNNNNSSNFIRECESKVEFICHTFISLYSTFYFTKKDENDDDYNFLNNMLKQIIEEIDSDFYTLQEDISKNSNHERTITEYSKIFVDMIIARFNRLLEIFYPEYDFIEETTLAMHKSNFMKYYFDKAPTYEKIGSELFQNNSIYHKILSMIDKLQFIPSLDYEFSPIYNDSVGVLELYNDQNSEVRKHLICFHICPDPNSERLAYLHFHTLRGSIFHELISHALVKELRESRIINPKIVNDFERCNYLSHGWFLFYAFILSDTLHITDRCTQKPLKFDNEFTNETEQWLIDQMSSDKNHEGIKGFISARTFYGSILIGRTIDNIFNSANYLEIYDKSIYEKAEFLFESLLKGIINEILSGEDIDETCHILDSLVKKIDQENLEDSLSIAQTALISFLASEKLSLEPIRERLKE